MDEQKLSSLKEDWREAMTDSINDVLQAIEEEMPESAVKHNELLALKLRLNDANKQKIMGMQSAEQLNVLYNALRYDILMFIDELSPQDFEPAPIVFGQGQPPPQKGTLLHKIPRKMAVGKEVECIIRLAFERAVIADNLDLTDEVEVKDVVVSKVMEAELLDPNAEPAFRIRTFSDEEQFLQTGTYTEWKFLVTPIREGAFKLLLKISVVEIIEGKERIRNISFEEMIQIISAAEKVPEAAFTHTGIEVARQDVAPPSGGVFQDVSPKRSSSATSGGLNIDLEKVKQPMYVENDRGALPQEPAPAAPAPKSKKRSRRLRGLSMAASLLVVVGTIAFLGLPMITGEESEGITEEEVKTTVRPVIVDDEYRDIQPLPTEEYTEAAAWEYVQKVHTIDAYEYFLTLHPESIYADSAAIRIKDLMAK
jgi:hypothetical protein